jgi:hypothetical protein
LEGKVTAPPSNSDPSVTEELQYLSQLTTKETTEEQRKFAKMIENDGCLPTFINYAGNNGIMYDEKHLRDLAEDLTVYCNRIKNIYMRPRPSQLAFLHQLPLKSGESDTPSYPSLPTFVSKVLAYVIGYNNPKANDKLHAIAKKIELSRLYGGYNFPSDNMAALQMADVVRRYVKHLHDIK